MGKGGGMDGVLQRGWRKPSVSPVQGVREALPMCAVREGDQTGVQGAAGTVPLAG